jgi:hypothetical protein
MVGLTENKSVFQIVKLVEIILWDRNLLFTYTVNIWNMDNASYWMVHFNFNRNLNTGHRPFDNSTSYRMVNTKCITMILKPNRLSINQTIRIPDTKSVQLSNVYGFQVSRYRIVTIIWSTLVLTIFHIQMFYENIAKIQKKQTLTPPIFWKSFFFERWIVFKRLELLFF